MIAIINKQFHYFTKVYVKKSPNEKYVLWLVLNTLQSCNYVYIRLILYMHHKQCKQLQST